MIKSIGERYKSARKFLGVTLKEIYQQTGVSSSIISRIETGKLEHPNYRHTKFLIEQGVNPYFLIGKSKEVAGQKADIAPEEYETLKNELDELKTAYQKLEEKQEWMEQMLKLLKIDTEELENFRQKDE